MWFSTSIRSECRPRACDRYLVFSFIQNNASSRVLCVRYYRQHDESSRYQRVLFSRRNIVYLTKRWAWQRFSFFFKPDPCAWLAFQCKTSQKIKGGCLIHDTYNFRARGRHYQHLLLRSQRYVAYSVGAACNTSWLEPPSSWTWLGVLTSDTVRHHLSLCWTCKHVWCAVKITGARISCEKNFRICTWCDSS